ncbi:phenylalanine--tRNA ligase subunit beta [Baaleninema simplex]|uniref:phenylalanine--tRNA ligase subunit beta n=1 Tax=Baaleninema simplex TaxID=2862350 RepID=UPI000349EA58|nr:phenylalanine--tRNA ligase subunit beta [Baaleninema simplex]
MRISLNWLRELVNIDLSAEDLAHRLTMAGFEVEDIEDRRTWAEGVVLGKIVGIEPHPNADKLRVCQVNIGTDEPQQIVCGAPNAKADLYVPVATVGTVLPQVDLKIKPAKLRGVPSNGMICSLEEVGLSKESEGIHVFGEGEVAELDAKIGNDARPFLGLDDTVLDLTATANRADALSMVGVAREVAALTGAQLKLPHSEAGEVPRNDTLKLDVADSNACPTYIGTAIEGVKIAPSPAWLKQRLEAAGVRPINNVVDITNYVMLEWGQPLHAFDRDRLQRLTGSDDLSIGVRFAKADEPLTTLDGQERKLSQQALVITANDKPIALGGVMGGEESEVHEGTTNLVLEAALFDPVVVRRSSRSQSLRSESSSRYERGVNFAELEVACQRAISLICELAGGTPVTQAIADTRPELSSTIQLRCDRVRQVLGDVRLGDSIGDLPETDMKRILEDLSFEVTETDTEGVWNVKVPPYRSRDIEREIDLIEEIARLYGYDNFCETLPKQGALGQLSPEFALTGQLREAFRAAGLTELIHYSLVKPSQDRQIKLGNPLFAEYSALRTELLPALIDAFEYNLKQGNGALNGFEIGRVFWKEGEEYREKDLVAGILGGDPTMGRWTTSGKEDPMDWFEAKGVLQSAFDRLSLEVQYRPDSSDERLHPGRTASLWLRGRQLGRFGQLHPQLRQERELPDEVYVFELELSLLLEALPSTQVPKFTAFSTFPASDRDLAFFAPVSVSVFDLEKVMGKAGGKLLESVELFDEYRGENVPDGQRSLAFRLVYRAGDRTLKDKEVDDAHQKVRNSIAKKFDVELRS